MTKIFVLFAFLIGANWAFNTNAIANEKGGEVGNPILNALPGVMCEVTNKYMYIATSEGAKVLASYSVNDAVTWTKSSDTINFDGKYKLDMTQLLENVHDPIDGLSIKETREVLAAASKVGDVDRDINEVTEISLTAPRSGFLGFGKKGDWKTAKVSSRIKTGGNFSSSDSLSEDKVQEARAEIRLYNSEVLRGISSKTTNGLPDLAIVNEASFKCKKREDEVIEVGKEVNNSSRSNLKGSISVKERSTSESQPTATSQK